MAKTKVTVKSPDFRKWENAVRDLTTKAGEAIVENAVETAPTDTGNYKSQISYDGANTVTAKAKYSAAIEYGFDNYEENVNAYERVITQAFGKKIDPKIVNVKAHTRTMNRTPNPVLRNAAAKVQKEIPQLWKQAQRENGL